MKSRILSICLALACGAATAHAAVVWDNGTYGGTGTGQIIPASAGYDTLGVVVNGWSGAPAGATAQRNADDFVISGSEQWDLNSIDVYAYQTGSAVNPFTNAYVAVFNVDPTGTTDLNPIYGGTAQLNAATSTNRFLSQVDTTDDRGNTTRNIHKVTLDLSWLPDLSAGHYWIAWALRGAADGSTVASMPVVPGQELHGPNNGLAWGRTRHAPPGVENFWQYADGNIPAGGDPNSFQTYEYAFQLNGTVVPEPTCLALLLMGGLLVSNRRR